MNDYDEDFEMIQKNFDKTEKYVNDLVKGIEKNFDDINKKIEKLHYHRDQVYSNVSNIEENDRNFENLQKDVQNNTDVISILLKSNQKLAEDIYDLKVQNKYRVEEIEELQGLKQRMDWTEEFMKQNCDGLVEVNEDLGIIKIKINNLKKVLLEQD